MTILINDNTYILGWVYDAMDEYNKGEATLATFKENIAQFHTISQTLNLAQIHDSRSILFRMQASLNQLATILDENMDPSDFIARELTWWKTASPTHLII